jgi:hypothetical protein
MLADLCVHFSEELPVIEGVVPEEIEPLVLRRWAVVAAAGIVVRSTGAAMAMLACGYQVEAGGQVRRIIEAQLNTQEVLEDASGQYGLRYLRGRPRGLTKLAAKYKASEDVELMSMVAHADARGLAMLSAEFPTDSEGAQEIAVNLLPSWEIERAHDLLYAMAYECGRMCAAMADAFGVGVEIPPWISGELLRLREVLETRKAQQSEPRKKSTTPGTAGKNRSKRRRRKKKKR